jgi:SAM-dependent methyltransferase
MKIDIRAEAAKYYDKNPDFPNDIPFYQKLIPSPDCSILELGCGTGRVTLELVPLCQYIQGIDLSPAMISVFREKLAKAKIPLTKVQIVQGDISDFDLNKTFDFIIAPFRVLQNLETDQEVDGLFRCIRRHLSPSGTCILNTFRPFGEPEEIRKFWSTSEEKLKWTIPVEGGRFDCYDRRAGIDVERLILYPELIYRRYVGENLAEEKALKIVMRCYYPETFERLITEHGFAIHNRWGGYDGESYGQGPELILQFGEGT